VNDGLVQDLLFQHLALVHAHTLVLLISGGGKNVSQVPS